LALVSCPVRLTPPPLRAPTSASTKLNRKTGNRLKQQMIDSRPRMVVERDETIMGYEFREGKYVKVEPEEIDALKIESSEIITIERIVKGRRRRFPVPGTPYIMEPTTRTASTSSRQFARQLNRQGGVVRHRPPVLSRREQSGDDPAARQGASC